jgi:prephenate dehydrogenase
LQNHVLHLKIHLVKKISIGIIGGTGGMGRLFASALRKLGHKVLISSRHTALTIEECAHRADWIIVTVPIRSTEAVIRKIGPLLRKDQLLMDFTSLKSKPVDYLDRVSHPLKTK